MWHVKITKPSVLHDFRSTMSRTCQQVEVTEVRRQEGMLPYIQSAKQHNAHLDLWISSWVVLGESYYKMKNCFCDRFFFGLFGIIGNLILLNDHMFCITCQQHVTWSIIQLMLGICLEGSMENWIKIGSLHAYMSIHNLVIQRTVCAGDIL